MAQKNISSNEGAATLAGKINDNFAELANGTTMQPISKDDSAPVTVQKLNRNFGDLDVSGSVTPITQNVSAPTVAAAINANFDILYYNADHPTGDSESLTFDARYCTFAGKKLNASGATTSDSSCACTGYIPIPNGATLRYSSGHADSYYAFYNSGKTFISGGAVTAGTSTVTIPSGAAYLRFTNKVFPFDSALQFTFTCEGAYAAALAARKANDTDAPLRVRRHVLMFGNSYTGNYTLFNEGDLDTNSSTTKIKTVLNSLGVSSDTCSLIKVIMGSHMLQDWAYSAGIADAVPKDTNTVPSPTREYSRSVSFGTGYSAKSTVINHLSYPWDVVIFQERSADLSNRNGSDDGTTITEYMRKLAARVRELCPNPDVKVFYSMPHVKSANKTWDGVRGATQQMFAELANPANANEKVNEVVPIGTSVQNLRNSYLTDINGNKTFSYDGSHLGAGSARYMAGCCLAWYLFGGYGTNPLSSDTMAFEPTPNTHYGTAGQLAVTNENRPVLQQLALNACEYPWEIHTITA